ncbi:Stealth CR1 domain-containing protein [Comamonas aquatica]|jgi:hypothetical protein|uniref:Stealth CR1 domain-containing protein n=1 Tax=Comamonas aquatica TaxID=225991 RepID=UPI00244973E2|nr:Stealth CR1 domain-containing protein [Comamonas aquatica]MDH0201927.1 stealth family protein [Comamonas aquatica]MDH0900257.1 stealth family protein [Comamonas aquatica]MDH1379626.1 stealth family protein [Comamonas aquatica]MDH1446980.1 stealth family protein [Comamonas aquatica]MDH1639633.1 stealth family protein [Comamonas aquatica]
MQHIDIVIAWVDGNDPEWKRRRSEYISDVETRDALDETRFASNDEIYFCIASILKYVPFCRNIFLVTDRQVPEFIQEFHNQGLCPIDKIRIVDHSEIFSGYEDYCPTFNSLSIESLLWRINGLSNNFIYLNDDFFFNAPAKIEDFFVEEKMVAYGHWERSTPLKSKLLIRRFAEKIFNLKQEPKHTVSQMLGADILGLNKFFKVHHYPHAMNVEVLENFFKTHPSELVKQIRHRFRSIQQINPVSLSIHLKIKKGEAVLRSDIPVAYLKNAQGVDGFLSALDSKDIKYGCVQSLDQFPKIQAESIYFSMRNKFLDFLPKSIIKKHREN